MTAATAKGAPASAGATLIPARDVDFSGAPCPRCLGLSMGDHLWPDMVMPLPQGEGVAPLARDGSGPCCHDCAAADSLREVAAIRGKHSHLSSDEHLREDARQWFIMARVAVGNDRLEQERLPGAPMGLVYYGLVAPSKPDDLDAHHRWLESLGVRLPWTEEL